MLRIHFTRQDLARTHVADGAHPMWEIVLSLQMLQARYARVAFAQWRREVRRDLHLHGITRDVRNKLIPLAPDAAYFPDFLTPAHGSANVGEAIDAVMATPTRQLSRELGVLRQRHRASPWERELATGKTAARARLGQLLATYHERAVEPYRVAMDARFAADRAKRVRTMRDGGVGALLDSFRPVMRWRPPVLEVDKRTVDRDLHLNGRGLVLVPSHFCWDRPISLADPDLPPTLVYPLARDPNWLGPAQADPQFSSAPSLAQLIGPTRAAVLRATTGAPNTTEIARLLGISPATVSQHTAVLRESGLITSQRHANSVLHVSTPLGTALLTGQTLTGQTHKLAAR